MAGVWVKVVAIKAFVASAFIANRSGKRVQNQGDQMSL
jgi:hypothetical protein